MSQKTFIVRLFTYVLAESIEEAHEIVHGECDYPIIDTREIKDGEVGIPWEGIEPDEKETDSLGPYLDPSCPPR